MHDYSLMSLMPKTEVDYPVASIDSAGIPAAIKNEVLVAPFNDFETTERIINQCKGEIAGVIIEPFQRVIKPKPGFLKSIRDITIKHKIPLIFDEIVTGFRVSLGGAQEKYGVIPDIGCFGKSMGNGMPISAVVGSRKIMKYMEDIFFSGTFGGKPCLLLEY